MFPDRGLGRSWSDLDSGVVGFCHVSSFPLSSFEVSVCLRSPVGREVKRCRKVRPRSRRRTGSTRMDTSEGRRPC